MARHRNKGAASSEAAAPSRSFPAKEAAVSTEQASTVRCKLNCKRRQNKRLYEPGEVVEIPKAEAEKLEAMGLVEKA